MARQKIGPEGFRLGASGRFPAGKLNHDDEGELTLAIGLKGDTVVIDFGKSVHWIGLNRRQAVAFAESIMEKAGARKIEVTF